MKVEELLERVKEIEAAIVNVSAQLNALQGHKAETLHWIERLKSDSEPANETQVESSVEPVVE